jgi:Tol biopolymer transport system component
VDEIHVVDSESGTSSLITPAMPHDDFPVWSPDGTRLVISQHDGRGRLQLIDADGGNRHAIVDDLTSGMPAAWSPDGTRIAFAGWHYPGVGEPGLYVVNADGTGLTLLVPGATWSISRIAWSPDGSMIAFAEVDDTSPVDGLHGHVRVVDVASGRVDPGGVLRVETTPGAPLAWGPGRMELLYAAQSTGPDATGREDIVLAEDVGGAWRERPLVSGLAQQAVANPMWLDPDRFAYVRGDRLWVASLAGLPERAIGEPALGWLGPGCVAPDGSMIAVRVAAIPSGDDGTAPLDSLVLLPTDGGASVTAFTGFLEQSGWGACSWRPLP